MIITITILLSFVMIVLILRTMYELYKETIRVFTKTNGV